MERKRVKKLVNDSGQRETLAFSIEIIQQERKLNGRETCPCANVALDI